jgi:predicted MFS family arabinose efflux permease
LLDNVFKAFSYPQFRNMWLGACTSSIGTWMQQVAQSWLVYQLSDSPQLLALDTFLGEIPIFLLSLVGGVTADRFDRRKIVLASQVVQLTCAFTITSLLYFEAIQIWHILTISFVVGCAQAFGGPAYSALVPSLVTKEDLPNAIALNSIQFNLARVIGPALAGIAMAGLGPIWCFGLNGLSYFAVIASLLSLPNRLPVVPKNESPLESMKLGINFVRHREGMVALVALGFLMTFFGSASMTFLPVVARDGLKLSANGYSQLMSISGIGSVCGALIVAGLGNVKGKGSVASALLVVLGLLNIGFAYSTSFFLSTVILFLSGGCLIASFALVMSLVQMRTEDHMRGRVLSVYNVFFRGGRPMGSLLTGQMITLVAVPNALAFNGALLSTIGLWFLLGQRRLSDHG